MFEEEKTIDFPPEEADEATIETNECIPEEQSVATEELVPELEEQTEEKTCAHAETMQAIFELTKKIDDVGEAVDKNAKLVDTILNKVLVASEGSAPEQRTNMLSAKIASVETAVASSAKVIGEIKQQAIITQNQTAERIRKMESELESYRKKESGQAFYGLYQEFAQVYVDFEDLDQGVEDKKLAKNVRYLLEEMEELLLSHGVEMMKSKTGEKRNLSLTQVVNRITTDDPTLDELIAESVSTGFFIEKRCLIKEKVNVYRYEAPISVSEPVKETHGDMEPGEQEADPT